jgi:hypothetical protein
MRRIACDRCELIIAVLAQTILHPVLHPLATADATDKAARHKRACLACAEGDWARKPTSYAIVVSSC